MNTFHDNNDQQSNKLFHLPKLRYKFTERTCMTLQPFYMAASATEKARQLTFNRPSICCNTNMLSAGHCKAR